MENVINQRYRVDVLENGLRVVSMPTDGNVAYIGVVVGSGSRDDGPGLDGLAHFVEHTIFKGTERRRGWQISNRMELVGGELNAYTTKECIMVYTGAPAGYEERAVELLADLVQNASFPADELDLERGVVLEEINSYRDNASYAVFDEFDELLYAGNALAHNILGYEDTVRRLTSADARRFVAQRFTPRDMVVYCMAPGNQQKSLRLIARHFGTLCRPEVPDSRVTPPVLPAFEEQRDRGNRQANTLLGVRIFGASDPRRYAMYLLSNILGGPAMNSRLNRELREKRGLVYTVETSLALFSDTGAFCVYYGTEPGNVAKCRRLVLNELDRLAQSPMPEKSFRQAVRQLCGQLLVSGDNRENTVMALAKSLMRYGEIIDNRRTADLIAAVTPDQLCEAARIVASQPMSRLTII